MRLWIVAGLASAMWAPIAVAAETTVACDVDETQRSLQQRIDTPAAAPAEERAAVRATGGGGRADAVAPVVTRETARRRSVTRRIPDAELIGGRGAL